MKRESDPAVLEKIRTNELKERDEKQDAKTRRTSRQRICKCEGLNEVRGRPCKWPARDEASPVLGCISVGLVEGEDEIEEVVKAPHGRWVSSLRVRVGGEAECHFVRGF